MNERGRIKLTDRKLAVLVLVSEGKSDKEIMAELSIGQTSVQYHILKLRHYFSAVSRTHLVACAFREGVLH